MEALKVHPLAQRIKYQAPLMVFNVEQTNFSAIAVNVFLDTCNAQENLNVMTNQMSHNVVSASYTFKQCVPSTSIDRILN